MRPLHWPCWGTVKDLWRWLAHVSITSGRCGAGRGCGKYAWEMAGSKSIFRGSRENKAQPVKNRKLY